MDPPYGVDGSPAGVVGVVAAVVEAGLPTVFVTSFTTSESPPSQPFFFGAGAGDGEPVEYRVAAAESTRTSTGTGGSDTFRNCT